MHYKPKQKPPKVETERFEIDARLIDLLEICSLHSKLSKNIIFEQAIRHFCLHRTLNFTGKQRIKRKYLVEQSTLDLIENYSYENEVSKNALVNKALKQFFKDVLKR